MTGLGWPKSPFVSAVSPTYISALGELPRHPEALGRREGCRLASPGQRDRRSGPCRGLGSLRLVFTGNKELLKVPAGSRNKSYVYRRLILK